LIGFPCNRFRVGIGIRKTGSRLRFLIPDPDSEDWGFPYFFMIIETIVSTLDESGAPNFAPMGVELDQDSITVRPFRNTRTYRNMIASGYGVANFTDDVLAYVQSALYYTILPGFPAKTAPGVVYQNACSWLEMAVASQGGSDERAELHCRVLYRGRQRDFLGFCRARNIVIEATVLATRWNIINPDIVDQKMVQYCEIVEKTGGDAEKKAFQLVRDFIIKRRNDD
jgi:uncharacterized protein